MTEENNNNVDMSFLDAETAPTGKNEEKQQENQQEKQESTNIDSSQPKPDQESVDKGLDEKYEKEEWARKRLNRQEQRHRRERENDRREMQEMMLKMQQENLKLLSSLQNKQSISNDQDNQNYSNYHDLNPNNIPVGNPLMPDFDYGQDQKIKSLVQKELAAEKQRQEEVNKKQEHEKRVKEENIKAESMRIEEAKLQDKYGDYHDVIYEATPYLTKEIAFALKELPLESLENFYLAWKENKEQIVKISQMQPFRQALEIAKLDALMSAKRVKQEDSSPKTADNQFISPVKPSVASGKHWLDQTYYEMASDYQKLLKK